MKRLLCVFLDHDWNYGVLLGNRRDGFELGPYSKCDRWCERCARTESRKWPHSGSDWVRAHQEAQK